MKIPICLEYGAEICFYFVGKKWPVPYISLPAHNIVILIRLFCFSVWKEIGRSVATRAGPEMAVLCPSPRNTHITAACSVNIKSRMSPSTHHLSLLPIVIFLKHDSQCDLAGPLPRRRRRIPRQADPCEEEPRPLSPRSQTASPPRQHAGHAFRKAVAHLHRVGE